MPTAHTSQTPASGDVNNGAAITTGARLTVNAGATCTAIAFYAPATNSGTYTGALYQTTSDDSPGGTGTGTLLASASLGSGSVTPGAWNNIPITPQSLSTGTVYTVAVHSSSGRIVATSHGFDSAITNGGVTLLAAGTDPNPPGLGSMTNGVFTEGGSLAYPNTSFNNTDYFVDLVLGAPEVTGTASAALGALSGTAVATRTVTGTAVAALGGLAGTVVGKRTVSGTALAALGALTGTAAGTPRTPVAGTAVALLGGLAGAATGGAATPSRTLLFEGPRRKGVTPLDSTRGTPSFRRRR